MCFFVILFPGDGVLKAAPPRFAPLLELIIPFVTNQRRSALLAQTDPDDIIHVLQARLSSQVLIIGRFFCMPFFFFSSHPSAGCLQSGAACLEETSLIFARDISER